MVSTSPSSVHSWPPYIDQGKLCRLRRSLNTTLKENDCALAWCSRVSPASSSFPASFFAANLRTVCPENFLASCIAAPLLASLVAPVVAYGLGARFQEPRHAVALQVFLEPRAPAFADLRLRQLHRRHALRPVRNRP